MLPFASFLWLLPATVSSSAYCSVSNGASSPKVHLDIDIGSQWGVTTGDGAQLSWIW